MIDAVDLYSDDSYTTPGRQNKRKTKQKPHDDGGIQASTEHDSTSEVMNVAPRPLTRAEIVAANRLRQHEEPHDEMVTAMDAATAAGDNRSGASVQSGGQNQTHARFQRWGKLLLAGVGEADELNVDPAAALDQQQRREQEAGTGEQEQDRYAAGPAGLQKELKTVPVQSHHFQNLFVFATRPCCAGPPV